MTLLKILFHLTGAITFAFGSYYDWYFVVIPPSVHRMGINFCGKLKFLTYWDAIILVLIMSFWNNLLFHLIATTYHSFGCYYLWNYIETPWNHLDIFGHFGKLKHLNVWNLLIQTFFFGLCVLCDITGSKTLKKFKNFLHTTIAFPLAFIVGITFWAIYAIDRELIFPKVLDEYFPGWLNHLMHTNIMVFTVIEMITSERNYPKRSTGIKTLIVFLLAYCIWMNIIYQVTGYWVYPIMEVLSIPLQILFYLLVLGFGVSLYVVGEHFNSYVWLKDISSEQRSNKNKRS